MDGWVWQEMPHWSQRLHGSQNPAWLPALHCGPSPSRWAQLSHQMDLLAPVDSRAIFSSTIIEANSKRGSEHRAELKSVCMCVSWPREGHSGSSTKHKPTKCLFSVQTPSAEVLGVDPHPSHEPALFQRLSGGSQRPANASNSVQKAQDNSRAEEGKLLSSVSRQSPTPSGPRTAGGTVENRSPENHGPRRSHM